MPTSDKKLIDQYCKRQKIKKANAELSDNRIYQKIKEDINNDESAPFEHVLQIDDSLKDIDIAARKFDIDYDVVHENHNYKVIFDPYHKYQSKRYQQMQKFVNQKLREEGDWLEIVRAAGLYFGFAFMIIEGLLHVSTNSMIWRGLAGILIVVFSYVYSFAINKKIKQLSAELPAKASDIKL